MEKKLLTLENSTKRGGMGPNMCYLCFNEMEIVSHLLIHCQFTKDAWKEIKKVFNFNFCWNSLDLLICFKNVLEKD